MCVKAQAKCSTACHGRTNQDNIPDCPNISSVVARIQRGHWTCNLSGIGKSELLDFVPDCLVLASIDELLDFLQSISSS